jgi:hypothetical protein
MALLFLPLLAFVAAHDSALLDDGNSKNQQLESRRAVNGTEMVLECPAASHLVRTHMAPDFEHPQLVRRLDWIHDGTLVASFHQVQEYLICGIRYYFSLLIWVITFPEAQWLAFPLPSGNMRNPLHVGSTAENPNKNKESPHKKTTWERETDGIIRQMPVGCQS